MVPSSSSSSARRLSDLTAAMPADRTLQNLLGLMSSKLELCSRLPILEYEAANEGHDACATTFRELAELERRSFTELVACLRRHLDETADRNRPTRTDEGEARA